MASEIQILRSIQDKRQIEPKNHYKIYKLGFLESIRFELQGYVKLGSISRGKGQLDNYLFKCSVHGLQVTTPSGYNDLLLCPECIGEVEIHKEPKLDHMATTIEKAKTLSKYLSKNNGENR